jgi:hypothetical protein
MSIAMRRERDSVYRVEIRGILRKVDLKRCEDRLVAEMTRVGPIRLLFMLTQFEGWERTDANDFTFDASTAARSSGSRSSDRPDGGPKA